MALSADILERVRSDFRERDRERAITLLDGYSGPGDDRVLRCALFLSAGTLEKLEHFLRVAEADYRDVILFAEYDGNDQRVRDFSRGFNH